MINIIILKIIKERRNVMNNTEKNEILEAIQKLSIKVDFIQKDVAKIPKMEKQVAKIPKIEKQMAKMQKDVETIKQEIIPEMQAQITNIQQEQIPQMQAQITNIQQEQIPQMQAQITNIQQEQIPQMQVEIKNISRSVAVIEKEHGEKIQILLDAFVGYQEKVEKNEKRTNLCEKKLEKHDSQIDFLMQKAQGL